jgi:gas vesicle protein
MKKFLIGAMMGAGLALLYAPMTGAQTRAKIRDKANGLTNDMTDLVEQKTKHMSNKMEGYKAKVRTVVDQIKEMVPGSHCEQDTMTTSDPTM